MDDKDLFFAGKIKSTPRRKGWLLIPQHGGGQMKILSGYLLFFILSLASPALWALSGSSLDPDLSGEVKDVVDGWKGSVRFRGIRDMRLPRESEQDLNGSHKKSVFGSMRFSSDLNFSYSFTDQYSLFISLDYGRSVVASLQELKNSCWQSYLCIGNMSVGASLPPFFKRGNFQLESSIYLNLPTSRYTVKSGSLGGPGALIRSNWRLLSRPDFQLSVVSNHFLDTNIPLIKLIGNGVTTLPTVLVFFNQPGLSFRYTGPFPIPLPTLYAYGSLANVLHTDRKFRNSVNLRASAAWTVKKKLRVAIGLQWGDRLIRKNGAKGKVIGNHKFMDRTDITLGVSYAF